TRSDRDWSSDVCSSDLSLPESLGLRLGSSDSGNDSTKQTTRHAYDLLATGFGSGFNGPLQLAVRLPAAGDTSGLAQFTAALRQRSEERRAGKGARARRS